MAIKRTPGNPGRSQIVEVNGMVQCVATAPDRAASMKGQTAQALTMIDKYLAQAGTDKSKMLAATVYITDMARWNEMQEAWMAWVHPGAEPVRACVQVGLAAGCLVEIVATAAK